MRLIGIDPGQSTGIAIYEAGILVELLTLQPHRVAQALQGAEKVVFEDSRLQSHTWKRGKNIPATLKMARNVGQVDAWCHLISAVCKDLGVPTLGISPKGKGAKIKDAEFRLTTGWDGRSNQHTRDAAMVAWPYRRASA